MRLVTIIMVSYKLTAVPICSLALDQSSWKPRNISFQNWKWKDLAAVAAVTAVVTAVILIDTMLEIILGVVFS